jgi:hypothetical protein
MNRLVIQIRKFSEILDKLIAQNKASKEDYEELEKRLVENPEEGDVMQGTGGLRKIRLKSVSKGKSGGFRVCYCDVPEKEKLFFIAIFPKNVQEDLTDEEKSIFKSLVTRLRRE